MIESQSVTCSTDHLWEIRPWGRFDVLKDESEYKAKIITVDPGAQLSYQSHEKRSEHWIIVKGRGEVVLNEKTRVMTTGEHIFIPLRAKHRIRNTGNENLVFVEVQVGSSFEESDIIRYDDDYARV